MSAGRLNLYIEQGATYYKTLQYTKDGSPVDLSGSTARLQVRPTLPSTDVLFELTTENGGIELETAGTIGRIDLSIEATDTAAFTFTSAVYDLEIVTGTKVVRLLQGKVRLSLEVTRP